MTALFVLLFLISLAVLALLFAPLLRSKQPAYPLIAIAGTAFIALSLGLYIWLGSPRILQLADARNQRLAELSESITRNSELVKTNSKNLTAWITLGQDFLETGQLAAASNAFRQAVVLSGGNPQLLLAYAKSLIIADDNKVGPDAKKALEMVLLQDKENADARYFMAIYNLENGNMPKAMQEMKKLYHELPDDSPLKATINRQIGRN